MIFYFEYGDHSSLMDIYSCIRLLNLKFLYFTILYFARIDLFRTLTRWFYLCNHFRIFILRDVVSYYSYSEYNFYKYFCKYREILYNFQLIFLVHTQVYNHFLEKQQYFLNGRTFCPSPSNQLYFQKIFVTARNVVDRVSVCCAIC